MRFQIVVEHPTYDNHALAEMLSGNSMEKQAAQETGAKMWIHKTNSENSLHVFRASSSHGRV